MSDLEAEVSTLSGFALADGAGVVKVEHPDTGATMFRRADAPPLGRVDWSATARDSLPGHDPAPDPVDEVEDSIAEVAAADNARRLEQMRRVRRAAVNRLIDFVRIEQLGLNGPNDRTSVEELTHDAIMKALDLYFEGRPKASPDSMSMAIDTLEKIQGIGPTPVQRAQMKGGK